MSSTPLPPLMRDQRKIDGEHLRLLAVFHFVLAGLSVVFLGFLFLHWFFLHTLLTNPELVKGARNGPPPEVVFGIFKWIYLFAGTAIVVSGLLNLAAGWGLLRHRWRVFCLVVAGVNCLGFPFGTALGVFTLIVLLRESVTELYAGAPGPAAGAAPVGGGG